MPASEEGQVNLNNPAQDENFLANPAHNLRSQSFSSDRVAPVKQLEELLERMIGGMVKDHTILQLVKLAPELSKLPGEHESVYMWVLSCSLFHKYIRLFSRDVSVFHHAWSSCQ